MEPIRENVGNTIRIMFRGLCSNIRIAELADDSFLPLEGIRLEKLEEQKKLKLEYAMLKSPQRIESIASSRLQMSYPDNAQVIVLKLSGE